MTLLEAVAVATSAGVVLKLDPEGQIKVQPAGRLDAGARATLREHRDRLAAVLALREVHRALGFSEADVAFIEQGLLSGRVREIRIAALPPEGPQ